MYDNIIKLERKRNRSIPWQNSYKKYIVNNYSKYAKKGAKT